MSEFRAEGNSVRFWLRIKPRAHRERLGRNASGELVLELTAPPVEGKANQAAVRYLAEALDLPPSAVEIAAGDKSRRKLFRISGGSAEDIRTRLDILASRRRS